MFSFNICKILQFDLFFEKDKEELELIKVLKELLEKETRLKDK